MPADFTTPVVAGVSIRQTFYLDRHETVRYWIVGQPCRSCVGTEEGCSYEFIRRLICSYGALTALIGAAGGCWLCWTHFRREGNRQGNAKARYASEILIRLRDLATRVAIDVEEHANRVEEINGKLTSPRTSLNPARSWTWWPS